MPTASPGISSLVMTGATASSTALFKASCGTAALPASINTPRRKHAIAMAAIVLNFILPHLLTLMAFKIYRLLSRGERRRSYAVLSGTTPRYSPSLPLDRAGRLRCHVVNDAVDPFDLVDDPCRDAAKQFVRKRIVVGGHAVGRGYGPERTDVVVAARVAHDADGLDRQ